HLVPEHAVGAGAGAVGLLDPVVEDALEEIEVDLHDLTLGACADVVRDARAGTGPASGPRPRARRRRTAASAGCGAAREPGTRRRPRRPGGSSPPGAAR